MLRVQSMGRVAGIGPMRVSRPFGPGLTAERVNSTTTWDVSIHHYLPNRPKGILGFASSVLCSGIKMSSNRNSTLATDPLPLSSRKSRSRRKSSVTPNDPMSSITAGRIGTLGKCEQKAGLMVVCILVHKIRSTPTTRSSLALLPEWG